MNRVFKAREFLCRAMLVFFTGSWASVSLAQEGPQQEVIYKQRTVYSFDGDTIDGDLQRPDGAYIETRRDVQHSNLIRVRDNFRDRMLESVVHL